MYEPLIDVLSPHTCIPDEQSSNSSSKPSGETSKEPSLTPASKFITPVSSIQNRKRKANSDEDNTGGKVEFYLTVHRRKMIKIFVKETK